MSKDSWATSLTKSWAEYFTVPIEERVNHNHRKLRLFDLASKYLSMLVDLSTTIDNQHDNAINTLKSTLFFKVVESLSNPSPLPIFRSIQKLPSEISKKIPDWKDHFENYEGKDNVFHFSYQDDNQHLVRWDIYSADNSNKVEFQIGEANPDKPSIAAQYDPLTSSTTTDRSYFQDGTRAVFTLEFKHPRHLPPFDTTCGIKQFNGPKDYNGTPVNPDQSLPDWSIALFDALPQEIRDLF